MADETLFFDWDKANIAHIARHRVSPKEAEEVLRNDPYDMEFETVDGEARWTSIGHTDVLRVLLVVWTMRGQLCRVVTAREVRKVLAVAYLRRKGV